MVKEEWVPGNKVVYVKNTDYVPRKEPPSWAAGGKVVKVDRVEWLYIPDSATAAAALNAGEVDWWEQLPPDLIPVLAKNKDVKIENIDPLGSMGMIRFNFLQPPFNNPKLRQALLYVVNQQDYVIGIAGDAKNGKPCCSYFTCGTPLATDAGSAAAQGQARPRERQAARQGSRATRARRSSIMDATDQPIVHSQSLITTEMLRKLGLNVELQAGDWGTLITRRASKEPVEKGGWSIFHTWLVGPDMVTPALNAALRGTGDKAWFGWPTDAKLEELRDAWFDSARPGGAEEDRPSRCSSARSSSCPTSRPRSSSFPPRTARTSRASSSRPMNFLWNVEKK